jgi:hypothetical protein
MAKYDKYLLRSDMAKDLHEWIFFSGSSDKNYYFSKVTDGEHTCYEVPFKSQYVKGFLLVDSTRSITLLAKRCDGVEYNKEFRTVQDTKDFLNRNILVK